MANESKDAEFMRIALMQAELAIQAGEVPVGCVFIRDGAVIGQGYNLTNAQCNATRHAEMVAIDGILEQAHPSIFKDSDLYVTCEPCIMCASALGLIGVRRVIYGCSNDKFGGCGSILHLHEGQYPTSAGVLNDEAIALFKRFYARENIKAPEAKRKHKNDDLSRDEGQDGV